MGSFHILTDVIFVWSDNYQLKLAMCKNFFLFILYIHIFYLFIYFYIYIYIFICLFIYSFISLFIYLLFLYLFIYILFFSFIYLSSFSKTVPVPVLVGSKNYSSNFYLVTLSGKIECGRKNGEQTNVHWTLKKIIICRIENSVYAVHFWNCVVK